LQKSQNPLPKKPKRKVEEVESDLDEEDWDSELDTEGELSGDEEEISESEDEGDDVNTRKRKARGEEDDVEAAYAQRRLSKPAPTEDNASMDVGHLPIKLPGGTIQHVEGTTRIAVPEANDKGKKKPAVEEDEETESSDSEDEGSVGAEAERDEMARTRGRFGRMGIADILANDDGIEGLPWKGREKVRAARRLAMAKEQIARVGAEVMAGGELMDNVSRTPHSLVYMADHFSVAAASHTAVNVLARESQAA
jgi:nucleolar complex protein 3